MAVNKGWTLGEPAYEEPLPEMDAGQNDTIT